MTRWPFVLLRLELVAAAEIDRLSNGRAIALQELHADERVAARAALHRLLGNGDRAAFGNQRDFARDGGFMRPAEVVAEYETRVQPGQRERAPMAMNGPGELLQSNTSMSAEAIAASKNSGEMDRPCTQRPT